MNATPWIGRIALAVLLGGATLQLQAQPQDRPARDDAFGERHDADAPRERRDWDDSPKSDFGDHDSKQRSWRGHRMDDQQIEAAYDIVVQLYPELAERLEALRDEDPRQFRDTLERKFSRVRFLVMLQKHDPPMFELRMADIKLDRETQALAEEIRRARQADEDDRQDALMEQIETKVAEHFDVRQQIRALEIEKLKQKLEELEERLDDRDDDRKDLIEQRVEELAGPDW